MPEECLKSGLTHHEVLGEEVGASFWVNVEVEGVPLTSKSRLMVCSGFGPGYYLFHGVGIFLDRRGLFFDYREYGRHELSCLWREASGDGGKTHHGLELIEGGFKNGRPRFTMDDGMVRGALEAENRDDTIVLVFDFIDGARRHVLIEGTDKILLEKAIGIADKAYNAFSFEEATVKELV